MVIFRSTAHQVKHTPKERGKRTCISDDGVMPDKTVKVKQNKTKTPLTHFIIKSLLLIRYLTIPVSLK